MLYFFRLFNKLHFIITFWHKCLNSHFCIMLSNCLSLLLLLWFVAIWAITVLGCAVFGAVCALLANWAALLWSVGSGWVSKVDIPVDVSKSWCPCQDKDGYWYSYCWKHPVFCGQYLFSFLHCSFYQMDWLSEITDKRFWCVLFPKEIVTLNSTFLTNFRLEEKFVPIVNASSFFLVKLNE